MSMLRGVVVAGLLASWCAAAAGAAPVDKDRLHTAARAGDWKAIEAMGPSVLPELARIYRGSSVAERAQIAQVFYNLGWKSEDAKRALMADVHTADHDREFEPNGQRAAELLITVRGRPQMVVEVGEAGQDESIRRGKLPKDQRERN